MENVNYENNMRIVIKDYDGNVVYRGKRQECRDVIKTKAEANDKQYIIYDAESGIEMGRVRNKVVCDIGKDNPNGNFWVSINHHKGSRGYRPKLHSAIWAATTQ